MEQKYLLLNEGEVIKWQGLWSAEKEIYAIGDVVAHAKTGYGTCAYKAIVGHVPSAATEPEVGASWETVWAVFLMGGQNGTGEGTGDVISAGKAGGQTIIGGTGAGESLILKPTSHSTKGLIDLINGMTRIKFNAHGYPMPPGTSGDGGLAVSWNWQGGSRSVDLWNTDTANTTDTSFWFRQLQAASYATLLKIMANGDLVSSGVLYGNGLSLTGLKIQANGDLVSSGVLSGNGLSLTGPVKQSILSKTADYTITDTDPDIVVIGVISAHATITLPTAADNIGRIITVIINGEPGAYNVIVDGEGAETINGAATKTNSVIYSYLRLLCNGVGWDIIGSAGTWT